MDIAVACTVIEFVDGIKRWDAFPLQGGELGNLVPEGIAAPLYEEAEKWIASTVDQLLLQLSRVDEGLIPKEEDPRLSHLGVVLEDCCLGAWDRGFSSHALS